MESTARLRIWVLVALIVVPLLLSLPIAWYTGEWGGLALNLCTELIGAGVTYTLLELVIGRRERREAQREFEEKEREAKKADLIAQMGSSVKDVAVAAAEELRRYGWLLDGSLQRAFLDEANLQEAFLLMANLQGASLRGANLQEAFLEGANLEGAFLEGANLQGAYLLMANLQGASLGGANLQGAFLGEANLEGAHLRGANLQGAKFHDYTTLPDGTKWTPDTDMTRFTDPKHPDFWRPPDA